MARTAATASIRRAAPAGVDLPADVRWTHATATLLGVLGAGLVLATLIVWLARQPAFAIRSIAVDGDVARNSVSTIRANAAPRLSGNFLSLDLGAVRHAFEAVPWVRHAVVQRVWPNRLRVRLEEHRAVALWLDAAAAGDDRAGEKLVNSHGEVFEANVGDVEDDDLPTFTGPAGASPRLLAMHRRIGAAMAPLGVRVEQLALSSRGSWEATLDSGAVIELGRGNDDEVLARADRFVATVRQVTGRFQRSLEYADLRHADGYAVRLRGITTPAPASAAAGKR